jgi:7-carboxy-7-deazaguanine synthase (Cx14CxxC type)
MTYVVKEIYYTLQGEGANAGRPAVLLRFAGCNLWSGREEDRATAICPFCDTDFVGIDGPNGGKFETAEHLAQAAWRQWPNGRSGSALRPFVVCTGGEPLLQLDGALLERLHELGFEIAVETNGTVVAPPDIDWICVSPKAGGPLRQRCGDELKLVYPQEGLRPEDFESLDFRWFVLQPMDGPDRDRNTRLAVNYCLENPRWRLGLQTHKLLGLR